MMYIAWVHNAQGEIHDDFGVSWACWLLLGFGWFVPVTLVASLISGSMLALFAHARAGGAVQEADEADTE
jgi:hypothetical protein